MFAYECALTAKENRMLREKRSIEIEMANLKREQSRLLKLINKRKRTQANVPEEDETI